MGTLEENDEIIETALYFFKRKTTELIEYDPENYERKIEIANLTENQGCLSAICRIPGNKIFHSGGLHDDHLNPTFIINLDTNTYENLPKLKPNHTACATYYKGKVYIFGGHTRFQSAIACNTFDLESKSWIPLADMPIATSSTSVLVINDKFLISGYENFLQEYNVFTNSFESISEDLYINPINLLIKDDNRICLMSNSIYVADINDIKNWKHVGETTLFYSSTSKPVVRGRFAYFSDCNCNIYLFGLDSYKIECIARF
ncbi:hypothetical protein SteCoe_33284 [Stentor coeruleus]|uniref:Uncharacterized protein n=1 Tax=Stentor coeruleus TaxID=5963 RepID=A0A1R2AX38_9CILI|nr:hypothetical protein SteCoe_33284 [Stentor coeruleus]